MNRLRIAIVIACAVVLVTSARADHAAGRQIYVSGSGKSPIVATMAGSAELPAAMLPCANCHGADGRGMAEGGVVPSNITWLELTKPYRAAMPNGRRRPAYTEQTIRRAVTEGIDSAGNPLHAAMPRYAMSPDDLSALVDYLKILGSDAVPGVTATSIRIGTIVPESAIGTQMAAVLAAVFDETGEIHGRHVKLDVVTPAKLDAALQNDPPFALAGGLIVGADAQVEEAVERAGVPLVLPVSMRGETSADNHQRFYLAPGLEAQVRGLLRFSHAQRVIVITRDEELAAMARRAAAPEVVVERRASVRSTGDGGLQPAAPPAALLFLDPEAKLADVPVDGNEPLLFLGNLLPEDFFKQAAAYGGRIRVALTTTPDDLSAGGLAEYRAFAARHSISGTQIASQLSAYAAAKVLVQALKHNGRELTRDSLRASLESFYEFDTGVTPPVTFTRSRRVAAPRVHVAGIDPKSGAFIPIGTFHTDD